MAAALLISSFWPAIEPEWSITIVSAPTGTTFRLLI